MTSLYVAAGGGGDALAAAIVHRALDDDSPAIIATYAWDRLSVDPLPGPRSAADFTGLEPIGHHNYAITPNTRPRPPSGSTLPRLAGDLDDTLVLLDPTDGARGMRAQLAELVDVYRPELVTVLDVGGDALAHGDEPGLRSPLADALGLAAVTGLDLPVSILVAGPGLDGELTEAQVLSVLASAPVARLTARDVNPFRAVLDWHPSEATALLAAAARGLRGTVEVRDAGLRVELTDTSAAAYRISHRDALHANPLSARLVDTTSIGQAEDMTREHCGFSEIDYERSKQRRVVSAPDCSTGPDLDTAIQTFEHDALTRGIDYVTFRRLAEAIGPTRVDVPELRRHLLATRPDHHHWPLWSLAGEAQHARAV